MNENFFLVGIPSFIAKFEFSSKKNFTLYLEKYSKKKFSFKVLSIYSANTKFAGALMSIFNYMTLKWLLLYYFFVILILNDRLSGCYGHRNENFTLLCWIDAMAFSRIESADAFNVLPFQFIISIKNLFRPFRINLCLTA